MTWEHIYFKAVYASNFASLCKWIFPQANMNHRRLADHLAFVFENPFFVYKKGEF